MRKEKPWLCAYLFLMKTTAMTARTAIAVITKGRNRALSAAGFTTGAMAGSFGATTGAGAGSGSNETLTVFVTSLPSLSV